MQQKNSLNDEDQKPWSNTLAENLQCWDKISSAVSVCSALKQSYRRLLLRSTGYIDWIFLSDYYHRIKQQMEQRERHFMKDSLLPSQMDALMVPSYGIHIDISENSAAIIYEIIKKNHSNA